MAAIVSALRYGPPEVYAKDNFIKNQRIIGVALIALGILASLFAPATGGASAIAAVPLVATGSVLIGASLIQQVVGEADGCRHGRIKRVFAGLFIMTTGPLGWLIGGILWKMSNNDNKYF